MPVLQELDAEGTNAQEADDITSQGGDLASGSDLETDSDASHTESSHAGPAPSESRSFASTYWRPERTDRNANLSVIDERSGTCPILDLDTLGRTSYISKGMYWTLNLDKPDRPPKVTLVKTKASDTGPRLWHCVWSLAFE